VLGEGTSFIARLTPRNQGHFKKQYHLLHFNFQDTLPLFSFSPLITWLLHDITPLDKDNPSVDPSLGHVGMGGLLWERPHPLALSYTFSWHQGSNVRTIVNMIF
jgi:hypothetical protein